MRIFVVFYYDYGLDFKFMIKAFKDESQAGEFVSDYEMKELEDCIYVEETELS